MERAILEYVQKFFDVAQRLLEYFLLRRQSILDSILDKTFLISFGLCSIVTTVAATNLLPPPGTDISILQKIAGAMTLLFSMAVVIFLH